MEGQSINIKALRVGDPVTKPKTVEEADNWERRRQSHAAVAHRRARVAALYATDMSLSAIIEQITEEFEMETPMTAAQIRNDVKAQVDYWRIAGLKSIDEKQAMVLANIQNVETLATDGYFASLKGRATYNYEKQIEQTKEKRNQQKEQDAQRERASENLTRPNNLLEEELFWLDDAPAESLEQQANRREEDMLVTVAQKIKEYRRFEETAAGDPRFLTIMLDCAKERAKLFNLYVRDDNNNSDAAFAKMSDADKTDRLATLLKNAKLRSGTQPTHLAAPGPLIEDNEDEAEQKQLSEAGDHTKPTRITLGSGRIVADTDE